MPRVAKNRVSREVARRVSHARGGMCPGCIRAAWCTIKRFIS